MALVRHIDIDIILLGKTGNGKSATGNAILGEKRFTASDKCEACSLVTARHTVIRGDKRITVADTPGLQNRNTAEEVENISEQLPMAMSFFPNGVHVMLLVVKYGNRFTEEEVNTVKTLKMCFGEDFLRDRVIIVVTYGDNFDTEHEEDSLSFDLWWRQQSGEFKNVINECNERIVLFYNNGRLYQEKREQAVIELLDKITNLMVKNKKIRYTTSDFEKCFLERENHLVSFKLPQLCMEFRDKINELQEKIHTYFEENKMSREDLDELIERCQQLLQEIHEQSSGTDSFDTFENEIEELLKEFEIIDPQISIREQLTQSVNITQNLTNPSVSFATVMKIVSLASAVGAAAVAIASPAIVLGAVGVAIAETAAAAGSAGVAALSLTAVSAVGSATVAGMTAFGSTSGTADQTTDNNTREEDTDSNTAQEAIEDNNRQL